MGGESQRVSLNRFRVILYARFIGNPSYLQPIRSLLEIHCRHYRGVYRQRVPAKNEGGGVRIGAETAQKHAEKQRSAEFNAVQYL
jgi:hypothetical protein